MKSRHLETSLSQSCTLTLQTARGLRLNRPLSTQLVASFFQYDEFLINSLYYYVALHCFHQSAIGSSGNSLTFEPLSMRVRNISINYFHKFSESCLSADSTRKQLYWRQAFASIFLRGLHGGSQLFVH
ncbi:hypothetical protein FGO68_gene8427 [Halteria grandinella]|uniref:Uncharacterized protein n=1 Tax=Halteria grandinella TaxID=5974 RepID=A0A8J8SVI2_HALGN|nr:hypothetical protein FGO68_gene8427 [Halteria grandinella]